MISRRAWIGAAAIALATGAGLSSWRERTRASGPSGTGPDGGASAPGAATAAALPPAQAIEQLFAMQLSDPAGAPLPMSQFRNKRLVVNFWATWCPPCIEEMPELSGMAAEFAGMDIEFVGIAIDQPANVAKFLQKTPVKYPIAVAGSAGLAMISALGNAQGGLPFTLVLNADASVRERYLGKVQMPALRQVLTS